MRLKNGTGNKNNKQSFDFLALPWNHMMKGTPRVNLALLFAGLLMSWGLVSTMLQAYLAPPRPVNTPPENLITHKKRPRSRVHSIKTGSNGIGGNNPDKKKKVDDDPFHDKERIMDMLRSMNTDPYSIDNATWALVPTWKEIQEIWGTEPRIWGLERNSCQAFRDKITDAKRRRIAVAGLFSTGTNLMAQLLQHNCAIPERVKWLGRQKGHGMEWQVPWGKHNPYRYRDKHKVNSFLSDRRHPTIEENFPVATIRDPYSWMTSMCRNAYTAQWRHGKNNCPNFVDMNTGKLNKVLVKFGAEPNGRVPFPSLAHMYNIWNGEYFNETSWPLLMIRFEDIVFYPRELTKQVCECAGGELMDPLRVYSDKDLASENSTFHYVVGTAVNGPGHGGPVSKRNGLVDAWIKYSKSYEERTNAFAPRDLQFAQRVLDSRITNFFGYNDHHHSNNNNNN